MTTLTCLIWALFSDNRKPFYNERKGNILFNDALSTFYLRLYGVRQMVKDHSDSERVNLVQELFYMHHPIDRITHTTAFDTPVVDHRLECEIAQWVHHEGSI